MTSFKGNFQMFSEWRVEYRYSWSTVIITQQVLFSPLRNLRCCHHNCHNAKSSKLLAKQLPLFADFKVHFSAINAIDQVKRFIQTLLECSLSHTGRTHTTVTRCLWGCDHVSIIPRPFCVREQYTAFFTYFSMWMQFAPLCPQNVKYLVQKYMMWDTLRDFF